MNLNLHKLDESYEILTLLNRDQIYIDLLGQTNISEYKPDFKHTVWLLIYRNNEEYGLLIIRDVAYKVLSFNFAVFEKYRNQNTKEILELSMKLLKEKLNCQFIITVQETNLKSISVVEKLNFEPIKRFKKAGDNQDLILFTEKEVEVM